MAYTRRTWIPEETALSAENMNNIEEGIVEAKAAANGNETMWTYIRNKISSVLGLTAEQYNGNAATVNSHTVESDVPADAVFTDTNTWRANNKDVAGYVAAPGAVTNMVWKTDSNGNPAWRPDANTTYADATTSAHGLMSAADKSKLDSAITNIATSDNGIVAVINNGTATFALEQKIIERTATIGANSSQSLNVTASALGITSEDMVAKWTIDSVMYQTQTDIWYSNANDSIHCSATIYGPNASTALKNCVSIFLKNNTSTSASVKVRVVMRKIGTTRV